MPNESSAIRFDDAVVIGGSVAGLLAARVLARHYKRVTVVDRDELSRTPEPRKGVPQGRHAHALLLRGQEILEGLFPGFATSLLHAGAVRVNAGRQLAWHHAGQWRTQFDTDLTFLAMTRPLLEATIFRRLQASSNVAFREQAIVETLQHDHTGRIRGVQLREGEVLSADLVIDAAGRGSSTPKWLEQMGFEGPANEQIIAPVSYASRFFRRPSAAPDWSALLITGAPAKRTGFIFAVEQDRWLVSLGALFDEPVPRSSDEFLALARRLAVPDLYTTIRECEAVSEVAHYRFTGSTRRRYERLKAFPRGLIVLGDAVCSFNPLYGQGMTVSAMEADLLEGTIQSLKASQSDAHLAGDWFKRIKPVVDAAWDGVLIEDYRFPELAPEAPLRLRPLQWYLGRVHRATYSSPDVTEQLYKVISFLDKPAALFRPGVVFRTLTG